MITLKNSKTEQECTFDDEEQAKNFLANSKDASDWKRHGKEVRAAVPAPDPAEQAAPDADPAPTPAVKPRAKK